MTTPKRRRFTTKELITALTAPCFKTLQCVSLNKETAFRNMYECPAAVRCFFEFSSRRYAELLGLPESEREKMRLTPSAEKIMRRKLKEAREKHGQG